MSYLAEKKHVNYDIPLEVCISCPSCLSVQSVLTMIYAFVCLLVLSSFIKISYLETIITLYKIHRSDAVNLMY